MQTGTGTGAKPFFRIKPRFRKKMGRFKGSFKSKGKQWYKAVITLKYQFEMITNAIFKLNS